MCASQFTVHRPDVCLSVHSTQTRCVPFSSQYTDQMCAFQFTVHRPDVSQFTVNRPDVCLSIHSKQTRCEPFSSQYAYQMCAFQFIVNRPDVSLSIHSKQTRCEPFTSAMTTIVIIIYPTTTCSCNQQQTRPTHQCISVVTGQHEDVDDGRVVGHTNPILCSILPVIENILIISTQREIVTDRRTVISKM